MKTIKHVQHITCGVILISLFAFNIQADPLADQLEGQYMDQTHGTSITLVIKRLSDNEVLISDPDGNFMSTPLKVSIIDKKINDLGGIKICNYVTTNKDVRFSEINGAITLSLFTQKQAFVGKKKHSANNSIILLNNFK